MSNKDRTVIGFIIFVVFFIIGLVLIDRETKEITESDDKD